MVMFWATWCPYCKNQMPALSIMKKMYKNFPNFEIIPISIDKEGPEKVRNYFSTYNIDNLKIYNDRNSVLFHTMGFYAIPTIVLISAKGNIIGSYGGLQYIDIKYLEEQIKNDQQK